MSEYIVGTDDHEGHWLTGEKIVRCRDCKYHVGNDTMFSFYNGTCDWWAESPKVDPDGFCKWGKRRDE